MDLRHLQALLGIADTGSFSGAATAIGTVQSNVSAQIARLENELDVVLVDRASGRLTEEGDVVAERSRRVLAEIDAMIADVAALRDEVIGIVRLGVIGTTGRWLVPKLFEVLRLQHPHIRLMVFEGTNSTLDPQLVSGRMDLAVVSLPVVEDELVTTPLFEEDLVLVVPADHALAQHGETDVQGRRLPLSMDVLSELELLLPLPGSALRGEIEAGLGSSKDTLRPSMELDGVRLIASLAFDGHGPAILPATSIPESMRSRFSLLQIEGMHRRRVGVAQRRHGYPSAPVRALVEVLKSLVSNSQGLPSGLHVPNDAA